MSLVAVGLGLLIVGHTDRSWWWNESNLEIRFVSVGHGNACLVKFPNGRCILFDGGSMENGEIAANSIAAHLSDLGATYLAGILISHTDTDHLNAVPFLIDRVPVGSIFLNPNGLNLKHKGLAEIATRAGSRKVMLRSLMHGDQLAIDPEVEVNVLHCPNPEAAADRSDNENSLVIEILFGGRKILLPGDISGAGQLELLKHAGSQTDILMAPHHGSLKDNNSNFSEWSLPQNVIISAGRVEHEQALREIYPNSMLYWTGKGAVRGRIDPTGKMQLFQWSPDQNWALLPMD